MLHEIAPPDILIDVDSESVRWLVAHESESMPCRELVIGRRWTFGIMSIIKSPSREGPTLVVYELDENQSVSETTDDDILLACSSRMDTCSFCLRKNSASRAATFRTNFVFLRTSLVVLSSMQSPTRETFDDVFLVFVALPLSREVKSL